MGLKQKLLDVIKAGYPDFDQEKDGFEIEFEGGGDSFGSFYSLDLFRNEDYSFKHEGEVDLDEHQNLLFEILEESGVGYNWNNAGTTGKFQYNYDDGEQRLDVETCVSDEYFGEVE